MNVVAIRQAYGLSQADLARALSCAPRSVVRWERGEGPTGIYRAVLGAMEEAATHATASTLRVNGQILASVGIGGFLSMRLARPIP